MTRHRSAGGVTIFDGQIYALGGHDGLSIFDSVSSVNSSKVCIVLFMLLIMKTMNWPTFLIILHFFVES